MKNISLLTILIDINKFKIYSMNWVQAITKIPIYVYQSSTDGKKYIYVCK